MIFCVVKDVSIIRSEIVNNIYACQMITSSVNALWERAVTESASLK